MIYWTLCPGVKYRRRGSLSSTLTDEHDGGSSSADLQLLGRSKLNEYDRSAEAYVVARLDPLGRRRMLAAKASLNAERGGSGDTTIAVDAARNTWLFCSALYFDDSPLFV